MLHTLHSESDCISDHQFQYLWHFNWDSVLLYSAETQTCMCRAFSLTEMFNLKVIGKNPNISKWNCEFNLSQKGRCYVSKCSLFDNTTKNSLAIWQILGVCNSCFISLRHFLCTMLGDKGPLTVVGV